MPKEYDSDFDDTPPSSPMRRSHPDPPTIRLRLRRHRLLIVAALAFLSFLYLFLRPHRPYLLKKPRHAPSLTYKDVDWRQFAYSQYATDLTHLCNSVMVFEALDRLGSKARRVLMYPQELDTEIAGDFDRDSQLLVRARDWYGVEIIPVPVQAMVRAGVVGKKEPALDDDDLWDKGITKFLAYNLTEFSRVIHFDSDVTVLKHMDELFLLPSATAALPRAYTKLPKEKGLSNRFIVVEPSVQEAERITRAIDARVSSAGSLDEDIINDLYTDSALVLPHRQFGLHTSEFAAKDHTLFFGNKYEKWIPDRIKRQASLIYFSDPPLPKPWTMWPPKTMADVQPACDFMPGTPQESGCRDREIWRELYNDFRQRRKDICGLLSMPAPIS